MTEKKANPLSQPLDNRESGADAAAALTQAVTCAAVAKAASPSAAAGSSANIVSTTTSGCLQHITVAFFFDGTGNNLDADIGTGEHSNVARLFRAHPENDDKTQIYRRYIPGIGTYFKEINDPGGTATGRGMGAFGQERLNWSFRQLAMILQHAEALGNNPSNKIVGVRISVFGFSRGSALARAFCRELQKSTQGQRGHFMVRPGQMGTSEMALKGGYPIEVYFLGIFDTVASVGLPLSANNTLFKRHDGVGWRDFVGAGVYGQAERDLKNLAFGMPGADPSPGPADGHGAWSDDLKIVDIVTQCVHMVSGHEMRNSFPLDSVLDSGRYPDGAIEMVYPGVHSDVGGGYRQGEGGKSALIAQMPLRLMLEKAIDAKVPLRSMSQLVTSDQKKDFAIDEKSSKSYDNMLPLWKSYMAEVNKSKPLGAVVLDHMRVYWRYRITAAVLRSDPAHAGRSGRAGHARDLTPEQQTIRDNEKIFSANRAALQKEVDAKQSVFNEASARRSGAEEGLHGAQTSTAFDSQVPFWKAQVQTAKSDEDRAYDDLHSSQAKLTTAADDSALIKDMDYYDAWLLEDAKQISQWHKENPNLRMRPHYLAVVEAYEEVVIKHQLMDESSDIYKLFNLYVHDSLSGFRTDNTRTSDPRVIYIGGDVKYKYAMNTVQHDPQTAEA